MSKPANTHSRRTVIVGAAALPLMPVTAIGATGNATDKAWAAYEAAKANYEASDQAYDAFEAAIPIGPRPAFDDYEDGDEWEMLRIQWEKERATYPANPFELDDDSLDALCDPITDAENAILSAKATTLVDLERKLTVISNWDGWNEIQPEAINTMLADVRSLLVGATT